MVLRDGDQVSATARLLQRLGRIEVDPEARRVSAPVTDRITTLTAVVRALDAAGIVAEDIVLRRPTLDDVFLQLTDQNSEVAA